MDWRDELHQIIEAIPEAEIAEGVGELARAQVMLTLRRQNGHEEHPRENLRHLRAEEVAELLGVDVSWVYRHREELGGVDLSDRCVRFPEARVRAFLVTREAVDCAR